jgi:(2Fe-2S) ferredoxin
MSYYRHHVFVCINQREDGEACCQQFDGEGARVYMKSRAKALGIHTPGQVRINRAGCLNRCEQGPVMVIYPEGIWYTYVDRADLDEIIEEHLIKGRRVERLVI